MNMSAENAKKDTSDQEMISSVIDIGFEPKAIMSNAVANNRIIVSLLKSVLWVIV
jgi:hypothetical protein